MRSTVRGVGVAARKLAYDSDRQRMVLVLVLVQDTDTWLFLP